MTPASGRKPKVGDRVWLENEGKRYEGFVKKLYPSYPDGGFLGEFCGLTRAGGGHDGGLGDGASNRQFLYPSTFGETWGFLDPAPEAPKPYEPMVGDVIRLPEGRIVWRDESGDYQIAFNDDPPGESCAIGAKIVAQATLVSRPEKPLAVGDRVRVAGIVAPADVAKAERRIVAIFAGDSGVALATYWSEAGYSTMPLADLRRAPEGT